MKLEVDEFGNVINMRYHDGNLLGFVFQDKTNKTLDILIESIDGNSCSLHCLGIEGFLASDIRNGSGIFDIYQWASSGEEGHEVAVKLGLMRAGNRLVERAENKLCLKIECIDDGVICLICDSIEMRKCGNQQQ